MAEETLLSAAENGDMDAQYELGVQYLYGTGYPKDPTKAAYWFEKAKEQGCVAAFRELGILLASGEGVPADPVKGAELIGIAADELDPNAMYHLGLMFEKGIGVPVNTLKALKLLAFSAMRGYPGAEIEADRIASIRAEERNKKLRSRPIVKLQLSDVDVEAACCAKMLNDLLEEYIMIDESDDGPVLIGEDSHGMDTIFHACPYCGAKIEVVPRDKQYFG